MNREDDTVLNYFDELEIHPEHMGRSCIRLGCKLDPSSITCFSDVSEDNDPKYEKIIEKTTQMMGDPRNYGPTPEEKEEMERMAAETKMRKEAEERAEREKQEAEEESLLKQRQEEWVSQTLEGIVPRTS